MIYFFLLRLVPGDPVAMLITPGNWGDLVERNHEAFGMDKPLRGYIEEARAAGDRSIAYASRFYHV